MKRRGGYRWTDPSTSRDSAHSVDASAREYDVLRMLSGYPEQPLNGWEMSNIMQWPTITVVLRLAPLRRKGMIEQRGHRSGPPPNLKSQIAYLITPYGLAFLANAQKRTRSAGSGQATK